MRENVAGNFDVGQLAVAADVVNAARRAAFEDQQDRISAVWEYFPIQFLQTRVGYRTYDGIPQNPAQNREQLFVELHILF